MALFLVINLGGFILLIASGAAVFFNKRVKDEGRPVFWRWLRSHGWEVGTLLGLLSFFSQYPLPSNGEWYRIYGIPFLVGAVGGGEDHPHGPGLPSLALNFLFWLLIPQFVLWVASGRRGGPQATSSASPALEGPASTPPDPARDTGAGPSP
ncbi:MAG: hypothetical protein HUU06_11350 [Planctomycetaceae bacterium]|nr:hypothetical protein [Planctomycetota bacterium]NUN53365.1 hypothetical protein [Planctomycetaceae bacterium]